MSRRERVRVVAIRVTVGWGCIAGMAACCLGLLARDLIHRWR